MDSPTNAITEHIHETYSAFRSNYHANRHADNKSGHQGPTRALPHILNLLVGVPADGVSNYKDCIIKQCVHKVRWWAAWLTLHRIIINELIYFPDKGGTTDGGGPYFPCRELP